MQRCSIRHPAHLGARDIEGSDDPLQGPSEGGQLLVQQHTAPLDIDVRARGGGAEVQEVDKPVIVS